jgi:hypothetical protein
VIIGTVTPFPSDFGNMRTQSFVWQAIRHQGSGTGLSPRTFVRCAWFVTVLIGVLVLLEFAIFTVVSGEPRTILFGMAMLAFLTIATWLTATVLGFRVLLPRHLWSCVRRWLRPSPKAQRGGPGVWDQWIDVPS